MAGADAYVFARGRRVTNREPNVAGGGRDLVDIQTASRLRDEHVAGSRGGHGAGSGMRGVDLQVVEERADGHGHGRQHDLGADDVRQGVAKGIDDRQRSRQGDVAQRRRDRVHPHVAGGFA